MDIFTFDCNKHAAPAYTCNKPGDNSGEYIRLKDATGTDNKKINWMVRYMLNDGFEDKHLDALCYIIGLMNDCKESEAEIMTFAHQLRERYAR